MFYSRSLPIAAVAAFLFLFIIPARAQTNADQSAAAAFGAPAAAETAAANETVSGSDERDEEEEIETSSAEVLLDETITVEDLGAKHARILPDSPWHVFKRFGRGLREAITFDPVKDATLKHQHAIQELAEVKQLVEERGAAAVAPAVITASLERFQDKLAAATDSAAELKTAQAEDPAAVSALVADFAATHIQGQTVLNNLAQDVLEVRQEISQSSAPAETDETHELEELMAAVEDTKDQSAVHLATVLVEVEETAEAIGARLTEALGEQEGSAFLDLKHLAVLDAIAQAAPDTVQTAVTIAKQATVEHFEEQIKAVPPAGRAEKLEQYVEHTTGDERQLFKLLDEIKQTADIPSDVLDKIETAKEICVKRFEHKLALIDDQGVQTQFLSDFTATGKIDELVTLEEFRNRMKAGTEELKLIEDEHNKSIETFKANFSDVKSQDQAELFRKLSQEMTQNPSPKVFKLVRELEAEVRSDPQKSAFLDDLDGQLRTEIDAKFRREGDRYVERYASLDPNDIGIFAAVDLDPAFKGQVLQKKTEKLKNFVKEIERPEEFDRFYERFYEAPDVVISSIKRSDPEFQQAIQYKWRKIEEQRLTEERERQLGRAKVDYQERELKHQFDRLTRQEEEEFFRKLEATSGENFEARKQLWEEKINGNSERLDERFVEQKRLFEERLKIDPFGCDDICQKVQLAFVEQDHRHQRERLADQLQSERNRIEGERARQARNNPLAGKCNDPAGCLAYCRANQGVVGCEWFVDEPILPTCQAPAYWDPARQSCVVSEVIKLECAKGQYWDGKTCITDPFYRPPDDFRRCPWGMYWHDEKAICVSDKKIANCEPNISLTGVVTYPENCNVPPVQLCPAERRWDPVKGDCVALDYLACQASYYFDHVTRRCEREVRPICAPGQTWNEEKKICLAFAPERCPAFDELSCPVDHYREYKQNPNGCWLPGGCIPVKQLCPKEPFPCPLGLSRTDKVRADGCTEYGQCEPPICPSVIPRFCAPGETPAPPDLRRNPCAQPSCVPTVPERCPQYSNYLQACPAGQYRNYTTNADGCSVPGQCVIDKGPVGACSTHQTIDECGEYYRSCEWKEGVCKPREGIEIPSACATPATCLTEPNCRGAGFFWCQTTSLCYRETSACPAPAQCGNSRCEAGETPVTCAPDCQTSTCNRNGVCDAGETVALCEVDCAPKEVSVCGDRICSGTESTASCATDCLDQQCAGSPYFCKTQDSCIARGSYWCNGRCEINTCAGGGATCGNGRCEAVESGKTCPSDCSGANSQCATSPAQCATPTDCATSGFYWCNGACLGAPCTGGTACNNNGTCDAGETVASCAADCGSTACSAGWTYKTDSRSCVRTGVVCSSPKACDACRTGSSQYCEWNSDGCPIACRSVAFCGNGVCDAGETYGSCVDCRGGTGTGTCATQASLCTTQSACSGSGYFWCLNTSSCYATQASSPCFTAPSACGDRVCQSNETAATCPADCGAATGCGSNVSQSYCAAQAGCAWYVPPAGTAGSCVVSGSTGGACNRNWICDSGETNASCPSDCNTSGGTATCDGDKICEVNESVASCPSDCGTNQFCDGICGNGESAALCPGDCTGGTVKAVGQTCTNYGLPDCSSDGRDRIYCDPSVRKYILMSSCSVSGQICQGSSCVSTTACNNNRICDSGETAANCPADCGTTTGTCATQASLCTTQSACSGASYFWCAGTNQCYTAAAGCSTSTGACGDHICTGGENSSTCPVDCGTSTTETCGNGFCGSSETSTSCPADCGGASASCSGSPTTCTSSTACNNVGYYWCASSNACYPSYGSSPCGTTTSGACGDHICQSNETVALCPVDCDTGTASCSSSSPSSACTTQTACSAAGYFWCSNNSICYSTQASSPCATSSAACGNGACESSESSSSCPADCGGGSTSCSTATPGMCHSSAACSSIGYFWCASSNFCYATQASSPCSSTSLESGAGRVAWSRDPLGRLAISVGEFAKSIFGFVAKAVSGF